MRECPKTAPEITYQLCELHYMPSCTGNMSCEFAVMCNNHFKRWLETEPEVKAIHEKWLGEQNESKT